MKNKNLYITLGILTVAGLGIYFCTRKKNKKSGVDSSEKNSNYVGAPQAGMPAGGAPLMGVGAQSFPSPVGAPPAGVVSGGGSFTPVGGGSSILPSPPNPFFGYGGLGYGGWGGYGGFGYPIYSPPQCWHTDANGIKMLVNCGSQIDLG